MHSSARKPSIIEAKPIAPLSPIRTLPALKEAVEKVLDREGASFFDLAPTLDILRKDDIVALLNDVLERREITSNYELLSEDHVYLYRQSNFHMLMRFIGTNTQDTLYANEFDVFVINPTNDVVTVPLYKCRSRPDSLQRPQKLLRLGDAMFEPGKTYRFEAYKYILDFGCEAAQDACVLIVHSDPVDWLTWVYDRDSLEPVESICTSLQASRIQVYVRLLGAMRATQAIPSLKKLATSDYANFVRWEAVESLSKIASNRCFEVLKQLAENDADPMIRKSAAESLELSDATPG